METLNYTNSETMTGTLWLTDLMELTHKNHHTEARILIAEKFAYLALYRKAFKAIEVIHDLEGSIPYGVMQYRNMKTNEMLEQIARTESRSIADSIAGCI